MMFRNAMDFARAVVVPDSDSHDSLLYSNNKLISKYKTINHKANKMLNDNEYNIDDNRLFSILKSKRDKQMKYSVGDIIKFKNESGVFQVEIKYKIPTTDAIRGFADDMVFEGKMRLEVHHRDYGEYIITMTSRKESNDTGKIIVCWLDTCNDEVEYYLGQIVQYEEKEDVFELMK